MDNKRKFSPPAVGGSSLLVIFGVLCLVIFSLVTLETARADSRLADAANRATQGWYEANRAAQETLAHLRRGDEVEGVTRTGDRIAYQCKISDTQALAVEVELDGADYTVLRWQAVSTAEWTPEDTTQLWPG